MSRHMKHAVPVLLACALLLAAANAQENVWQGSAKGPRVRAHLVDKDKNIQHRLAVVDIDVAGVALTDPTNYQYKMPDQGHIQIRLDKGPYILPMNNRIAFEGLAPGKHTIEVMLADNDYRPLGAKVELEVTIP
jgi:hypothetical protein